MRSDDARRAQSGRRTQSQRYDGHGFQVGCNCAPARHIRHIGMAQIFQHFNRPAAARAVDHTDNRESQLIRHLLGQHELAMDRGIGCAPTDCEIICCRNNRPAINSPASENKIRGARAN